MTTFALPTTLAPAQLEWGLKSNTWQYGPSPMTGDIQTIEMPGARWVATFYYSDMSNIRSPEIEAFLAKLRGMSNRFTSYNFFRPIPRGTARGTMTVSGAKAKGSQSVVISAGVGQAGTTLLTGDFISVNGEFKVLRADITLDGSGVATLPIEPPLRNALVGGEAVVWDKPTVTFVLNDKEVRWMYDQTYMRNITFSGTEVW